MAKLNNKHIIMCYKIILLQITKLNNTLTGLVNPYDIQREWPEKKKKLITFGILKCIK